MSKDQAMLNAFNPDTSHALSDHGRALVEKRTRLLGPAYRLFYEEPLHIVRGEGVWLYDEAGRAYLDAYNNVASVGHCRPEVVAAIAHQAGVLNTHTRYLNEGILNYAERLLATFPRELSQVMFACTGSEANDLALRVARRQTGGTGIIVTELAYHGVTATVAEMSPSLGSAVPLGSHVRTVLPPDGYRRGRDGEADIGAAFARDVQRAVDDMLRHGVKPAALIVDTVFSSDGVFTDPPGFLREAVETARRAGALFIADEVQAGFGRTGSKMWGFERHGLIPDIVTMGKPMGNGHPVSAMVAKPEVIEQFGREARYFNTFGGNPVSCAAAMATLDIIQRDALQQNAAKIGTQIRKGFRALAQRYDIVGDVRGDGLFIGVELVRDHTTKEPATQEAAYVVNTMRRNGVLISSTGIRGNTLKIRPLLPFTPEHANLLVEVAGEALRTL
ncbi:aspartate aminotransferase family protein [Paraburkholderia sacchari]|uniref:aspartate aminotransferase family protein n=1 Tax=Paraburkholderia sacchari TaxID=159450 RepID=UPI001BCBC274|nr:aminotransferase class III-fold pyridoxal phosphate-dependent enzyme [Paraburkholderia sacchari]